MNYNLCHKLNRTIIGGFKIKKIILAAGLILSLTILSACSMDLDNPKFETNNSNTNISVVDDSKTAKVQKSFNADNISVLDIYSKEIDVQLHMSQTNEIKVLLNNVEKDTSLQAKENGKVLEVKMGTGPTVLGLNTKTPTLHIYAPKKAYDLIKLNTQYANVTTDNLEANELNLNTNEGYFNIKGFKGNKVTGNAAHTVKK